MQVSIETMTGLERRLTIGVPAERVDREVDRRLKEVAGDARLDGFRPGKVPLKVLRQRFGKGVRQEVVGEVMQQTFYEAVAKESLQPAGQPAIDIKQFEPGRELQYVATFEVYPEVELGDLTQISVEKPLAQVTDADVDRMIETFRKDQGEYVSVDRPAADGDQLNIDYDGVKDGEPFEGGSAEGAELLLGSSTMIPGFEDGLVGAVAGQTRELALRFPDDYHAEELKGADVQFTVKVNTVGEHRLAELNEAFFAKYSSNNVVDEQGFRDEVAANLERELQKAISDSVKQQVMDQLVDQHTLPVPAALVSSEVSVLKKQMFHRFGQAAEQMDESMLPDDLFTEQAQRRVALGLLMGEYVKREELTAQPEQVREKVELLAADYHDPAAVVNYYYENQELLNSVESAVLEDLAVDSIVARAQVSEVEKSCEEMLSPPEPDEAPADEPASADDTSPEAT